MVSVLGIVVLVLGIYFIFASLGVGARQLEHHCIPQTPKPEKKDNQQNIIPTLCSHVLGCKQGLSQVTGLMSVGI